MRPRTRLAKQQSVDEQSGKDAARARRWWLRRPWNVPEAAGWRDGGRAFALVTSIPALLLTAWLLPGLSLLLAGRFLPQPMLLISAPLAVALIVLASWQAPARWPVPWAGERAGRRKNRRRASRRWGAWWGLAGTVAIAAGFAAWQLVENSPQLFADREPGAYMQLGYWIAQHGSLPITTSLAAFGGSHPGLSFSSFGFASHAGAVAPQLSPGLPIVLSAGLWAHGVPGAVLAGPILGGLALLAVGGLTGRLAGPQWAPAGALVVALTVPEVYTSRSAFSETLTQALLFGGLCLVVDALSAQKPYTLAALGGLALGLVAGVGAEALVMLLPAIVFAGASLAGRRRVGVPFAAGLATAAGLGLAGAFALTLPLPGSGATPFGVIEIMAGGLTAVTVVAAVVGLVPPARRRAARMLAARPLRWVPDAAALVVVGAAVVLAARPYLQTVRGRADPYIASLQRLAHLPPDPGRLYAEKSLYWVVWYLGAPALLLGVIGLALAVRLCLRALVAWRDPAGVARAWALPVAIIGWGFFAVLWQPYTVPDQPWASRRLVPVVIPGLVVFAVWVAARLIARAREQGAGMVALPAAVACFVAAVAVPPAAITFEIRPWRPTTPEVRAALTGLAFRRTGAGEYGAIQSLCAAIPGHSSVVILDSLAAREFAPVVRGMCGLPVGVMARATPAEVRGVISGIAREGRRPVLLGSVPGELSGYGTRPRPAVNLSTQQDSHVLTRPPTSTWPVRYALWMSSPGGTPFGS